MPYSLLCDVGTTLIASLGFKKTSKGTVRGVFAINKAGTVLVRQSGSPDATVKAIQQLVKETSHERF